MLVGLCLCSCSAKPDRGLWKRACEHELELAGTSGEDGQRWCVESLESHPAKFSNEMASCMLRGKAGSLEERTEAFDSCVSPNVRRYLDDLGTVHEDLDAAYAEVVRLRDSSGSLPQSLDGVDANTKDPWGSPFRYTILEDGEFELCSLGYDTSGGTSDDICVEQPFIYFQF